MFRLLSGFSSLLLHFPFQMSPLQTWCFGTCWTCLLLSTVISALHLCLRLLKSSFWKFSLFWKNLFLNVCINVGCHRQSSKVFSSWPAPNSEKIVDDQIKCGSVVVVIVLLTIIVCSFASQMLTGCSMSGWKVGGDSVSGAVFKGRAKAQFCWSSN